MAKPDGNTEFDDLAIANERLYAENARLRRLVDDDRQKFAAAAMSQWLALFGGTWSGKTMSPQVADQIAKNAVVLADAMLRALDT